MTESQANSYTNIAERAWEYAKSSGHPSHSHAFERWFKNRVRTLYGCDDGEVNHIWKIALKMHS